MSKFFYVEKIGNIYEIYYMGTSEKNGKDNKNM